MSTPHSARPDPATRESSTGYAPDRESDTQISRLGKELAATAWPAFLAAGLGSLVLGLLLLAWPTATLTIAAVLIGVALLVAGVLRLIDGFTSREASTGKRVASVVIGLFAVIVGLFCIRHYHVTIAALAVIVGLFWVLHGIADIAVGLFGGRFDGRGLTVFVGVLSLIAGLIVLFWPTISITILMVVIGIWLIVYGIFALIVAFRLRRIGARPAGPGDWPAPG